MFHFTIRDVLWLTVVVAMGLGWSLDHAREYSLRRKAEWQRDALASIFDEQGQLPHVQSERIWVYRDGVHWTRDGAGH